MHAINDVRKIKLMGRDVVINKGRLNSNHPSSSQANVEKRNETQKDHIVHKEVEYRTDKVKEPKLTEPLDVDKISSI